MKNKKIIILGSSGFIGKNLAIHFSKKCKVIGTYFRRKPQIKGVRLVKCDLTKKKEVIKVLKNKCDILIQAAATTSGAKDIISRPYIHVNDNAIINSMVTRAAYDFKIPHIINFSCTIMYGSKKRSQKETDFNPNKEIYQKYFGAGWMKIFVEKMCEFYAGLGVNKYTVIRHSNIYGPHDKFNLEKSHVFAATINKVVNQKKNQVTIWGNGREGRDLLYISDLVNFVELAIKKQKNKFSLYNVGYGKIIQVNDLVKKIIKTYDNKIKIKHDYLKKSISTNVFLDCNKAKKEIGWYPKISVNEGIKKTLKWYLKNKNYR